MNREVGKYIVVCVAVLCATIWSKGRGTIASNVWSDAIDFKHVIESMIK